MIKKISELTAKDIASICDHTFLNRSEAFREKAQQGESPVELRRIAFLKFLEETIKSPLVPYAVCVRPEDVSFAKNYIGNKKQIKVASVVGFPDGAWYTSDFKLRETELALDHGADEIDFVLNYSLLKAGHLDAVGREIVLINDLAKRRRVQTKMILETSELTGEQIIKACRIAEECGVDFVKTSTGFSAYGARAEDLKIMRENFPRGVKMSGGVNIENVRELLEAASGKDDGCIELTSECIRIGESSLLGKLGSY